MPAPKRIPDAEVLQAIQKWRGNVEQAAHRIGIAPNNLRKRLASLAVDLPLLRTHQGYGMSRTKRVIPNASSQGGSLVPTHQQDARPIFPASRHRPKLVSVETVEAAAGEVPIKTTRAAMRPVRVTPPQQEQLQRAAWALQARYEVPTDAGLILEQFIEEGFEAWLASKLAAK